MSQLSTNRIVVKEIHMVRVDYSRKYYGGREDLEFTEVWPSKYGCIDMWQEEVFDDKIFEDVIVELDKRGRRKTDRISNLSDILKPFRDASETHKECKYFLSEIDPEIGDNIQSMFVRVFKKAAKVVSYSIGLRTYELCLTQAQDGLVFIFEKVPGLFSEKRLLESDSLTHPMKNLSGEQLAEIRKTLRQSN